MARVVPFTKNRETIYDFLARARRFHCPVTSIHELDITELMVALEQRRASGRPIRLVTVLVKASSLVMEKYPRLNHHLFHGLVRKYEVDFEEVACNLIMLRRSDDGEKVLLPVVIEHSNRRSLEEIQEVIDYHLRTPLSELPQVQGIEKLKKLPRVAMKAFSFMCRADYRFYRKFFGTYGLSPLIAETADGVVEGQVGVPSAQVANVGSAFIPSAISDQARVVGGKVVTRKVLSMSMILDHYLVDGHDGLMAVRYFAELLASPQRLGL